MIERSVASESEGHSIKSAINCTLTSLRDCSKREIVNVLESKVLRSSRRKVEGKLMLEGEGCLFRRMDGVETRSLSSFGYIWMGRVHAMNLSLFGAFMSFTTLRDLGAVLKLDRSVRRLNETSKPLGVSPWCPPSWIRYLLPDRSNLLRRPKQDEEPHAHRSSPLIPLEE